MTEHVHDEEVTISSLSRDEVLEHFREAVPADERESALEIMKAYGIKDALDSLPPNIAADLLVGFTNMLIDLEELSHDLFSCPHDAIHTVSHFLLVMINEADMADADESAGVTELSEEK